MQTVLGRLQEQLGCAKCHDCTLVNGCPGLDSSIVLTNTSKAVEMVTRLASSSLDTSALKKVDKLRDKFLSVLPPEFDTLVALLAVQTMVYRIAGGVAQVIQEEISQMKSRRN